MFPVDGSAPVLVIANGTSVATAGPAAAAAAALHASLLLTPAASLPTAVAAEVARLAPSDIVIVGPPSLVSDAVRAQLALVQPDVTRVTGVDRFAIAEALARRAFTTGASRVDIVVGDGSANTLAAAALAAHDSAPLVFVRATDTAPSAALASLISDLGATSATVVGLPSTVSAAFAQSLTTAGLTVDRVAGANRFDTSYAVAARYGTVTSAVIVSQSDVASGVALVAFAASISAPIMVANEYCVRAELQAALNASGATSIVLGGSDRLLRGLVASLTPCRSTTDPASIWVLVNKRHALQPASYVPSDLRYPAVTRVNNDKLRGAAATALEQMVAAAKTEGAGKIGLVSGYRSYLTQRALYNRYVATRGRAWADARSARPGFSEHQTGMAMDLAACTSSGCSSIDALAGTAQGKWLAKNAYRFGFVLRYEPNRMSTTGYTSEPWHFRYVGLTLAQDYHDGAFHTLEGYLDSATAPTY